MAKPAPAQHQPRRRGAQPGNQNARKHGLYSRRLPAAQAAALPQFVKVTGLAEEIALIRLRIRDLLGNGGSNDDLLRPSRSSTASSTPSNASTSSVGDAA